MKTIQGLILFVVLVLFFSLNGWVVYAQGCGPVPPKPAVPPSCADLVPQCVCTGGVGLGHNPECHWEWSCVLH